LQHEENKWVTVWFSGSFLEYPLWGWLLSSCSQRPSKALTSLLVAYPGPRFAYPGRISSGPSGTGICGAAGRPILTASDPAKDPGLKASLIIALLFRGLEGPCCFRPPDDVLPPDSRWPHSAEVYLNDCAPIE